MQINYAHNTNNNELLAGKNIRATWTYLVVNLERYILK